MQVRIQPVGERDCVNCGIREHSLFAGLTPEEFRLIDQPVHDVTVGPDVTLFDQGSPGLYVYVLRNGLVKLVRYQRDGSHRIIRLLTPGDIAGLECTAGGAYDSVAVTVSSITACRMPVSLVHRLQKTSPGLHDQLLRKWHQALRQADDFIADLASGNARQRLARLLILLARADSARQVLLPSREDVGAMLGVTTETASRTAASFRREGLMKGLDGRGRWFAVDVDALVDVAGRSSG
jgi:CRP/FNR family transcriptional regulator